MRLQFHHFLLFFLFFMVFLLLFSSLIVICEFRIPLDSLFSIFIVVVILTPCLNNIVLVELFRLKVIFRWIGSKHFGLHSYGNILLSNSLRCFTELRLIRGVVSSQWFLEIWRKFLLELLPIYLMAQK